MKITEEMRWVCLKGYEIVTYPIILFYLSWFTSYFIKFDFIKYIWLKLHGYEIWTDDSEEQEV